MIDLVLYAANKATMRTFAMARGILNADGYFWDSMDYCWWAGTGRFRTDGDDPSQALPGVIALVRIWDANDEISEGSEQWQRSKIAKYIKTNGQSGTMGGIPYYELDSVRFFRAADVESFIAANNLPGHEWFGGNSY